jgi:glutathione S-transferase
MIKVHHLNNARSQRILWLLEELGLPYEVVRYERAASGFGPSALFELHPLGKVPVIEWDGQVIAESGAAVELITARLGGGRLMPAPDSADYVRYIEMLHYPEGSGALPWLMRLFSKAFGAETAAYAGYVKQQATNHLDYIAKLLADRPYIVGADFTAADIQLAFTMQMACRSPLFHERPVLVEYLRRLEARPAYKRALESGGMPYTLGLGDATG